MPPRVKTTEKDILDAAIQIVREDGYEALNARSLAVKLKCSVQPIFRVFHTMEGLKAAVYGRAEEIYNKIMMTGLECSNDGFQGMGIAYVSFAKSEKNLFRLLFMTGALGQGSAADIAGTTTGDDEVLTLISSMTGLDRSKAQELYTGIWFTAHGIASLLATNNCTLSTDETTKILNNTFHGLLYSLKKEMERK